MIYIKAIISALKKFRSEYIIFLLEDKQNKFEAEELKRRKKYYEPLTEDFKD